MINAADLQQYCPNRGFGTPDAEGRPWLSTDASVILAWTETIKAQKRNYWKAIAVPPSMIKNGRLVGRIKLVSILRPRVQRRGDKYIATRFEANIQSHHKGAWTKSNILDPLESKTLERVARAKYAKWQPTRCFEAVFTEKNGPYIDPDKPFLRIGGRVYWRHKYIFDPVGIRDEMHEVSFALTLESSDLRSDTYNEFRQLMADNVVELVSTIEEEVTTGE